MNLGRIDSMSEKPLHEQVKNALLESILSGKLAPDMPLPSERELQKKFDVSQTTVRRALHELQRDGLIYGRQGRGTYVHRDAAQTMIAILFGPSVSLHTAHFYRALFRGFRSELASRGHTCRLYDGFRCVLPEEPDDGIYQLKADIRRFRFAGFLDFSSGIDFGENSLSSSLPHVLCDSTHTNSDVQFDDEHFAKECVGVLAQNGRQRITYMERKRDDQLDSERRESRWNGVLMAAEECGLPTPRRILLDVALEGVALEREVFRQVMRMIEEWKRMPALERPDSFLCPEDISTRAAALAFIHSGISVPNDLMVVSQVSEDVHLHYGIPVVGYEYSSRQLAKDMVDLLEKRIQGETEFSQSIVVRGKMITAE